MRRQIFFICHCQYTRIEGNNLSKLLNIFIFDHFFDVQVLFWVGHFDSFLVEALFYGDAQIGEHREAGAVVIGIDGRTQLDAAVLEVGDPDDHLICALLLLLFAAGIHIVRMRGDRFLQDADRLFQISVIRDADIKEVCLGRADVGDVFQHGSIHLRIRDDDPSVLECLDDRMTDGDLHDGADIFAIVDADQIADVKRTESDESANVLVISVVPSR